MGCGQSRVSDDEDSLADLLRESGLSEVLRKKGEAVKLYSNRETYVRNLVEDFKLRGERLYAAMLLTEQIAELVQDQITEDSEYRQYMELHKKFKDSRPV